MGGASGIADTRHGGARECAHRLGRALVARTARHDEMSHARGHAEVMTEYKFENGQPLPLGAIPDAGGVDFSVFAEHAKSVTLLLFDTHDQIAPTTTVQLSPVVHKRFHFWHVYVRGLGPGRTTPTGSTGLRRARAGAPLQPQQGPHRPVRPRRTSTLWDRGDACVPGDNLATSMRSVVIDISGYDWEGDRPLDRPHEGLGHLRDARRRVHPARRRRASRPSRHVRGVIEKIPYLKELGVTAVELLPVIEFDCNGARLPTRPDGSGR